MRRHALIIIFAIVVIAAPIFSQSFDVASIKRNTTADPRLRQLGIQPGGRLVATNAQVRLLIQTAYQLPGYRVLGGPDWIDSDGYDIEAKAGSEVAATPQQMRIMQQSLLADRFTLRVHSETRELPIYELNVAKNGLKLPSPTDDNCSRPDATTPPPPPGQPSRLACGRAAISISSQGTRIFGSQLTMAELTRVLSIVLARNIIDKTRFVGIFNVDLPFLADQSAPGLPNPGPGLLPPPDPAAVTIFTAAQEQLGLKLDSTKGPVEVLVIDSVERPSEN